MLKIFSPSGRRALIVFAMTLASLPGVASVANAQADDQYETPTAPSGPAAGEPVTVLNDTDGIANAGDELLIEGDYTISDGSSATLQDDDGTQGTFVDGTNAEITEGSIKISVTGDPVNVAGGDEELSTKGLFVVATTGIAAGSNEASAATGVLPRIGGAMLLAGLGALALIGSGAIVAFRRYARK